MTKVIIAIAGFCLMLGAENFLQWLGGTILFVGIVSPGALAYASALGKKHGEGNFWGTRQ